jgi:hypothetical protein
MSLGLRQEFRTLGWTAAKTMASSLERYGFRPGSITPENVRLWSDAVAAYVSGFCAGWGLQTDAVNATIARGVTAFQRFYTFEMTKH